MCQSASHVIIFTFIFSSSAQTTSKDYLTVHKNFNLCLNIDSPRDTVILNIEKNELTKKYRKDFVLKGIIKNQKKFTVNFTNEEKKLLWKYIERNKILSINPVEYNAGKPIIRYPRIKYTFKIKNNNKIYEYKIEALNHFITTDVKLNKFWGLYKILELMLNSRRMSLQYELWIINDLRERVKEMDTGKPLPFPDDKLPGSFRNLLKKPERLKRFIETWDKYPII